MLSSAEAEVKVVLKPLIVSTVSVLAVLPPFVVAQDYCKKQFVVSQVNLQTENGLATSEQAAVRARLIGLCFDSEETGEFRHQVLVALYDFGYLDATVSEPSITVSDSSRLPESVSLDVEFDEGVHYWVREVVVVGNREVPADQAFSVSQIRLGDFLDMVKVQQTVEAIRRLYAANGYSKASIAPSVRRSDGHSLCVTFAVMEGPRSP